MVLSTRVLLQNSDFQSTALYRVAAQRPYRISNAEGDLFAQYLHLPERPYLVLHYAYAVLTSQKEVLSKLAGVYAWFNVLEGKLYIGSSTQLLRRPFEHFLPGKGENKHLREAFTRDTPEAFLLMILWQTQAVAGNPWIEPAVAKRCTETLSQEVRDMENKYLAAVPKELLYNILPTAHSSLGYVHTEDSKKLLSEAAVLRENAKRASAAIKTKETAEKPKQTAETPQQTAETPKQPAEKTQTKAPAAPLVSRTIVLRNKGGRGGPFLGKKHSPETKARIAASVKKAAVPQAKQLMISLTLVESPLFDLSPLSAETTPISFSSARAAALFADVHHCVILRALKGPTFSFTSSTGTWRVSVDNIQNANRPPA